MRLRLVHAAALAGSILLASCSARANEDRFLRLGDGDSGAGGHDPGTGGSGLFAGVPDGMVLIIDFIGSGLPAVLS